MFRIIAAAILSLCSFSVLANNPIVKLETNKGVIEIELDAAKAPVTVENFLSYVKDGHYDGTIFHRVINKFMIQGGGFTADMQQKPTKPAIINEAYNGLKNERGTIAMARTSMPDSATAQFFINTVPNEFLDFRDKTPGGIGYCVFGKVIKGMEVVDEIEKVQTATVQMHGDVPVAPVVITKATLGTAAAKPADAKPAAVKPTDAKPTESKPAAATPADKTAPAVKAAP
jgi:cyclophilin family peptidyl-prolyl cis-trans isomerase